MKVGTIKRWLGSEFTPFTWQRIMMRLLPEFRAEGMPVHQLTDDAELNDRLFGLVNQAVQDLYQTTIPNNLEQ